MANRLAETSSDGFWMMKGAGQAAARGRLDGPGAERIAVAALGFLAGDPERLVAFLDASGLDPTGLRAAAADRGFLSGILDHVAGDEDLLLAFAEHLGEPPERIMAARHVLSPLEEP